MTRSTPDLWRIGGWRGPSASRPVRTWPIGGKVRCEGGTVGTVGPGPNRAGGMGGRMAAPQPVRYFPRRLDRRLMSSSGERGARVPPGGACGAGQARRPAAVLGPARG
jgi:hypothetical protein